MTTMNDPGYDICQCWHYRLSHKTEDTYDQHGFGRGRGGLTNTHIVDARSVCLKHEGDILTSVIQRLKAKYLKAGRPVEGE